LLEEIIEDHLVESSAQLYSIKQNLNQLQRTLQYVIERCEEKSTRLTSQFHENYSAEKVRSVFSSSRDFFQSQLKFLKHAYKHVEIQSAVGKAVLGLREKAR
jgi:hypothetical protein